MLRCDVWLILALLTACSRSTPSASTTSTSASAAPQAPSAAAPGLTAEIGPDAAAAPHSFLAYQGKIGERAEFRLALDRSGDHIEGIYARNGEDSFVRGDLKSSGQFALSELVPKGKKGATIEGKLDGMRIVGTWKDASGPQLPFTAGPLDPFGTKAHTFEQAYLGSLGGKTRIRMKLKKDGAKVSGVYRYTRSKDDLTVDGTVNEADGRFDLKETNAKGNETGQLRGIFLERTMALGRWTSPDGARSLPFTLRVGDAFPEAVALVGAGKVVPQEDYKEQSKYCTMSIFFPEVVGTPNKTAEKALNLSLRTQAGDIKKMSCEDASEDLRYETDTTYQVEATRPNLFAISFQFYEYAGGAHGMHALECYAADTEKGTLTKLASKLLPEAARKKLETMVNAALKKDNGVQKLTEAGFNSDDVTLGDETMLCVEGADLLVQFQSYEVAPYAMGAPSVTISRADAIPLVAGTPLAPFFK